MCPGGDVARPVVLCPPLTWTSVPGCLPCRCSAHPLPRPPACAALFGPYCLVFLFSDQNWGLEQLVSSDPTPRWRKALCRRGEKPGRNLKPNLEFGLFLKYSPFPLLRIFLGSFDSLFVRNLNFHVSHCFAKLSCVGEKNPLDMRGLHSQQSARVRLMGFSSPPSAGPLGRLPLLPAPSTGPPSLGPSPCGLGSTFLSRSAAPEKGVWSPSLLLTVPSLSEASV